MCTQAPARVHPFPLAPASHPVCATHLAGFGHRTGAQHRCLMWGYTLRAHKSPVLQREIRVTLHLTVAGGRDPCIEPLCHLESVHSVLRQPFLCQKKNTNRLIFFRIIKQRNSNKAKNIEMVTARVWLKFPKITSARV